MKIIKYLYIAASICISGFSNAANTAPDNIVSIAAYGLGNIAVKPVSEMMTNPANCVYTSQHKVYKVTDTTDHGKQMLAILLAAKSSGSKVILYINDTICDGNGYALITGVVIN